MLSRPRGRLGSGSRLRGAAKAWHTAPPAHLPRVRGLNRSLPRPRPFLKSLSLPAREMALAHGPRGGIFGTAAGCAGRRGRGGKGMCGIIGYVGQREAEPILVEGLRRLEYRGYDSAGIATLTGPHLHLRKRAGRIADLAKFLSGEPAPGCHGISHTRWATHGPANDRNAHPHLSTDRSIAVVHNGVIENYSALKR